ncbi:MAG: hypothetical protein RLN81_14030 [Balneolaceae bacterium]
MKSPLAFLFLSISLLTCSVFNNEQEEEHLLEIITSRTWISSEFYEPSDQEKLVFELAFNKDGTYVRGTAEYDSNNNKLGYRHWIKYGFRLENNKMITSIIEVYEAQTLENGEIVILPLNELLTSPYLDTPTREHIYNSEIVLSENKDSLWINPTDLLATSCSCFSLVYLVKD